MKKQSGRERSTAKERKEIEREKLSERERGKRNTGRQYTHSHTDR